MEIRKAKYEDISALSTMLTVLDRPHYNFSSRNNIKKHVDSNRYHIAIENGKAIGAICLIEVEKSIKINALVSKKKGVGASLINFAIKFCKDQKIVKLWCYSLKSYNAFNFYEKMGFEEIFMLKKQWHGEDCYFLGKLID